MTIAYIGLGANLGQAQETILQAVNELRSTAGIQSVNMSALYSSAPVDSTGPEYVNAVACIHTTLSAIDLLAQLQAIELRHGRTRPYHNAPRTLDLDLLLFGNEDIQLPHLIVPHPRMHERAFVLRPLADLAPELVLKQGALSTLLAACAKQAIRRLS